MAKTNAYEIGDDGDSKEIDRAIPRVDSSEVVRLEGESRTLEDKIAGESTSGDDQLVAGASWVWYKGFDKENNYHVFKLLAQKGKLKMNEVTIGLTAEEYQAVMRDPTKDELKDPFLKGHPYIRDMVKLIEAKKGAIVVCRGEEYNLWRTAIDMEEGVGSRVYIGEVLQEGVREDPEKPKSPNSADETDVPD